MIAEVIGHNARSGYVVTILYSTAEIEALIAAGATDLREKLVGHDLGRARRFCVRWNRRHGKGLG